MNEGIKYAVRPRRRKKGNPAETVMKRSDHEVVGGMNKRNPSKRSNVVIPRISGINLRLVLRIILSVA